MVLTLGESALYRDTFIFSESTALRTGLIVVLWPENKEYAHERGEAPLAWAVYKHCVGLGQKSTLARILHLHLYLHH